MSTNTDFERYSFFDFLMESVFIIDKDRNITYLNIQAQQIFSLNPRRLLKNPKKIFEVFTLSDSDFFSMPAGKKGESIPLPYEVLEVHHFDGKSENAYVSINPDKFNERWVVYIHFLTMEQELEKKYKAQKELSKDLEHSALTDVLTQVPNLRAFQKVFELELNRCILVGNSLGLIICDIDFFKKFNDSYGHKAGDEVLKSVAQRIKGFIRKNDFFARYGGEEFLVLAPGATLEGMKIFAEKLRECVESHRVEYEGHHFQVTISLGGICLPKESLLPQTTLDSVIKLADENLYKSKNSGRNCSTVN